MESRITTTEACVNVTDTIFTAIFAASLTCNEPMHYNSSLHSHVITWAVGAKVSWLADTFSNISHAYSKFSAWWVTISFCVMRYNKGIIARYNDLLLQSMPKWPPLQLQVPSVLLQIPSSLQTLFSYSGHSLSKKESDEIITNNKCNSLHSQASP